MDIAGGSAGQRMVAATGGAMVISDLQSDGRLVRLEYMDEPVIVTRWIRTTAEESMLASTRRIRGMTPSDKLRACPTSGPAAPRL